MSTESFESFVRPPINILYIENDEAVRLCMVRVNLRSYNVTAVASGEDAIEAISKMPLFDVILSDYDIDGFINGGGVLAWIQENQPNLASKFLFCSGNDKAKGLVEDWKCLEKPFSKTDLHNAINRIVQGV